MITTTKIYFGTWGDKDYVYALSPQAAVALVKSHFAYGDPNEDDYAVGETWVTDDNGTGWRVREADVEASEVKVEVRKGDYDDTSHLVWTCPDCCQVFSEQWKVDESLPVLLKCGCNQRSKFYLGVIEMTD